MRTAVKFAGRDRPLKVTQVTSSSQGEGKTTAVANIAVALAEEFDVVLVDSSTVLPVTDTLVVSRFVDATLVVVDSRSTARKAVRRTLQLLDPGQRAVVGVAFNGAPAGGGYGYGYANDTPKRTLRRGSPVPASR